jgi:hypothetical protein
MSKESQMKALAASLSALVAYGRLYGTDKEFDDATEKVYNSLIREINS